MSNLCVLTIQWQLPSSSRWIDLVIIFLWAYNLIDSVEKLNLTWSNDALIYYDVVIFVHYLLYQLLIMKWLWDFYNKLLFYLLCMQVFYKMVASGSNVSSATYSILLKNLLAAGKWRKYIEVHKLVMNWVYYT